MTVTSKLCDAADWFRPDVQEIITNELHETPRFHRKQWEFALIFLALREAGKLAPGKLGLSMGGGRELIAYALAPHVQHLTITDLYETNTSWTCARTDDPDAFIKNNKPFPVDDAKLNAVRMDMRDLQFPDGTFDFCYSTCAVEHIGTREDFLKHLNEVARVLKDDGIYVFTTEVSFDDTTVADEHNYIFSLSFLYELFAESNLVAEEIFDARIAPHKINYPLPSTLSQLSSVGRRNFAQRFLQEAPHIHLLRGNHPFTCGLFLLKKKSVAHRSRQPVFRGLRDTQRFADAGVAEYRAMLENTRVTINPFSLLPATQSRFFADHAEFQPLRDAPPDTETIFHTDYFWFGTGPRVFEIAMRLKESSPTTGRVEIRIHRFKTLASHAVECVASVVREVEQAGWLARTIELETDDDSCYAVLAKLRSGFCTFDRIEVKSNSSRLMVRPSPMPQQSILYPQLLPV